MPVELSVDGPFDAVASTADRLVELLDMPERELSVLLTGDPAIRELNRRWRGIDAPTDVLSFPMNDPAPSSPLGDIAISVTTARRQAEELGHSLEAELVVLLVHGVCHLLGHDHHGPREADVMRAEEARLLVALGADPAASLVRRGWPG